MRCIETDIHRSPDADDADQTTIGSRSAAVLACRTSSELDGLGGSVVARGLLHAYMNDRRAFLVFLKEVHFDE